MRVSNDDVQACDGDCLDLLDSEHEGIRHHLRGVVTEQSPSEICALQEFTLMVDTTDSIQPFVRKLSKPDLLSLDN